MRKFIFAGCGLLALAMLASCESKEEKAIRAFAEDFGEKASENEIEELTDVYPGLEQADSIAMDYNAKDIKVSKADDGTYDVQFNNETSLNVKYVNDGKIEVLESTGLFAYPKNAVKFAKAIGGIKDEDMPDSKVAIVMNNLSGVMAFLMDEYMESRKDAITVSGPTITEDIFYTYDEGRGYYTLTNNTNETISRDEYTINSKYETDGSYAAGGYHSSTDTEKGGDIPAGGTYKWYFTFWGHGAADRPTITMKHPTQDRFMSMYKAKGNEYKRYKAAHPEDIHKTAKLDDGPYYISGKLGGKYAIHMTLEKGMKGGSYYYDKYGPNNTLQINVNSFDPKTGHLVLQEINKEGDVTGSFEGTLSNTNFVGDMKVYTRLAYKFDLNVTK